MNPDYQTLCVLGAIAASATFVRVSTEAKPRVIDWIALASLALLLGQLALALSRRPSL